MSTKCGIWGSGDVRLYEESMFGSNAVSPAYIEVGAGKFKVDIEWDQPQMATIEIEAEVMDQLAEAWLKHRELV